MRRYMIGLLLVCNMAVAGVLAWLWVSPEGELREVHWIAPRPRKVDYGVMVPALPAIPKPDNGQYLAMLDRPIFSATRRPPPPPPPPAPPPPVDHLATARLSGTFEGGGVGGILINVAGKDRRVRLNESVEGWSIKSIQGRNVTFAREGQTRVLQLPRAALNSYTGLPRAGAPSAGAQPPTPRPPSGGAASEGPRAVFGGTAR